MLASSIIEPDTLEARGDRVSISVRMPWYRALPLSSITNIQFSIDGIPVERDTITWTVDGDTYTLDELVERWDRWWYVLDSAVIEGKRPELPEQDEHEVHVFVGLFIPYLPKLDGVRAIGDQDRKTMALKEAA